jgi:hypothetical protein
MLTRGTKYQDLGEEYFTVLSRAKTTLRLVRQLTELGYQVELKALHKGDEVESKAADDGDEQRRKAADARP